MRVLLIEDEQGLADALEYQLQRHGYDVERAADGVTGIERFRRGQVDLVLLDLMLPRRSGEDVCREIRRSSNTPIIMLTAKDAEVEKVMGLELGADDYVTKPFSTAELLARINAVLRRTTEPGAQRSLRGGDISLDPDRFEATYKGEPVYLPRKEFELLRFLMEHPGQALTRESLMYEVWGPEYVGDTRTLDQHVKRLRQKLEEDPGKPAHIVTVRGVGYKFIP